MDDEEKEIWDRGHPRPRHLRKIKMRSAAAQAVARILKDVPPPEGRQTAAKAGTYQARRAPAKSKRDLQILRRHQSQPARRKRAILRIGSWNVRGQGAANAEIDQVLKLRCLTTV